MSKTNNTTKQTQNKIQIKHTGLSLYIVWEQLDQLADQWAKKAFGDHVHGKTERDEADCYIVVNGLLDSDYERFKAYFEKYDKDGDYEVEEEFAIGASTSVFPEVITLGILNEELSSLLGHAVSGMFAGYDGVCFTQMNPRTCNDTIADGDRGADA